MGNKRKLKNCKNSSCFALLFYVVECKIAQENMSIIKIQFYPAGNVLH